MKQEQKQEQMEGEKEQSFDLTLWRAVTERSPLPMATVEGSKHILRYVNPAFCHLLMKKVEELTGRRFSEVMPQPDRCVSLLDRVYRSGQAETHSERRQLENLHPLYTSLLAWPVLGADGRPSGVTVQVTETARFHARVKAMNQAANQAMNQAMDRAMNRQLPLARAEQQEPAAAPRGEIASEDIAQEAQRLSEERFRAMANAVPNIVWSTDAAGRTTFFNEWWYEFTGMTPEQSLGERGVLDALHPDDRQRTLEAWTKAIETGNVYEIEYRLRRASDGSYRWHLARGIAMNTEGSPVRWFGTCTDIDDLKRAHQVLIRTEKLASAGRMAASVAHEINNPLEAIMNTLYLAQSSEGLPESVRDHLRIADSELMRISHITRQSLGFYRESSVPTSVSIPALLDSVLDLLQAKIRAKLVTIEKQYEKRLQVMGISGELRQVFSNLLANSLDAVDEHGVVKLRASSTACLFQGRVSARITIADTGRGIDPGLRQRIFEPFFTTKGEIGTGLGLWVSKQLIDKHGGSIRVHSRIAWPHRGSVFSIILPCDPTQTR